MYEHKSKPLAPKNVFYRRQARNFLYGMLILSLCLSIGITGYHFFGKANWLDAVHNASMILSGMGPVIEMKTTSAKIFSSFYALFSGVVFITNIGLIIAPSAHRFLHKLHLEERFN
ncbi:hypothetical protein BH09BAC2_BH09BAC2_00160 [soil metagenome]